jgi:hypothetical protein
MQTRKSCDAEGIETYPLLEPGWFGCGRRSEGNDVIRGRDITGVPHGLRHVGGVENDGAGTDADPFIADECFDGSLLHDDEFIIRAFENRVIGESGIERGSMALEHFEVGCGSFENLPAGTICIGFDLERVPFESL